MHTLGISHGKKEGEADRDTNFAEYFPCGFATAGGRPIWREFFSKTFSFTL